MAKIVETVERDGHVINVYESGAEYDTTDKKLIKGPTGSQITAENASVYIRRRQEKQARLLREAIVTETNDKLTMKYSGPAAAVAAAGGILWREVVLDETAYPRDRMEAWEKLGKYAQVLPSDIRQAQPEQSPAGGVAGMAVEMATAFARVLADIVKQQAQIQQRDNVVDAESQ